MLKRMTLDQFTKEVGNRLEQFDRSIKSAQAEGVDGFVGDQFERRTFDEWMAEFHACEGSMIVERPRMTVNHKVTLFGRDKTRKVG